MRWCGNATLFAVVLFLVPGLCGQTLDGVVRTFDGQNVAHVTLTIDEDNAAATVTSGTGGFSIPIKGKLHLKMNITFHIQNWMITQPCDLMNGRLYLLDPLQGSVTIKVLHKGDPLIRDVVKTAPLFNCLIQEQAVLFPSKPVRGEKTGSRLLLDETGSLNAQNGIEEDGQQRNAIEAAGSVVVRANYVEDRKSESLELGRSFDDKRPTESPRGDFLETKAVELGISTAELKGALETWGASAHDAYSQALIALYRKRYADAAKILPEFVNKATTMGYVNYVLLGRAQFETGEYGAAESSLRIALERFPEDPIILNDLAVVFDADGRYADATPLLRREVEAIRVSSGEESLPMATALGELSTNLFWQGKIADAETLDLQALKINETKLGRLNPKLPALLLTLGAIYMEEEKYDNAYRAFQEVAEMSDKVLSADDPQRAAALFNLGGFSGGAGRFADEVELSEQALRIDEAHYGPDHPALIADLVQLGLAKFHLVSEGGDYTEVQKLFERAQTICEKKLSADSPQMAQILEAEAFLFDVKDDYKNSEVLYQRALAIDEKQYGPQSVLIESDLEYLGGVEKDLKHYTEAKEYYQRAMDIERASRGETTRFEENLTFVAVCLEFLGKDDEAVTAYEQSVDVGQRVWVGPYASERPNLAKVVDRLVALLHKHQRDSEAAKYEKTAGELRASGASKQ